MTIYHLVEVKVKAIFKNDNTPQRAMKPLEEWCFRYELGILLDERTAKLSIHSEGDFVVQDEDYICAEIQKRLATNHARYPSIDEIKQYLKNVSAIMRRELAAGRDISALSYAPKAYKKKRGRPKLEMKRGKKRPIEVNGKAYESIAEAARATGQGYSFLKQVTLSEIKQAQERDNSL